MAVIIETSEWQQQTSYSIYRYVKPSVDNGFYYVCRKNGTSGITEPFFTPELNSITLDNGIEWLCVKKIQSDFDINSFLPEVNRDNPQQRLWYALRDMMTFIISDDVERLKNIAYKYLDPYSLDDVFVNEIIKEMGYDYIVATKVFDSNELKNLLFFIKVIHALKGTRKGVRLVLDLIGYPYNEELWYEMSPQGQPHTAKVDLEMTFNNFTPTIFEALNNFFKNYVYPIVTIIANIEPFTFVTGTFSVVSVPDRYYESEVTFEIPELESVSILSNTGLTYNSVTLNWESYESIALSEYLIDISDDNFVTFVTGYWDKHIDKNSTSLEVTGLAPNTEYKYRIRARLKDNLRTPYTISDIFETDPLPIPDTEGYEGTGITEVSFTVEFGEI